MFKSLMGRFAAPSKPIELSRLHLQFLSSFRVGGLLDGGGSWSRAFSEPVDAISQRFVAAGLIEPASLATQFTCSMGSGELKAELRRLGLKVSGRKPELAERLATAPGAPSVAHQYWTCTEAGHALAQQHLDSEEKKRTDAEIRACAAIEAGDLERAAEIGGAWDAGRVFPSGLGMDGMGADFRSTLVLVRLKQAQRAIDAPPKALSGLSRHDRERLVGAFLRAAVMGEDVSRPAALSELSFSSELEPKTAIELLFSWVEGQRQLDGWRDAPFEIGITILGPDDCPHAVEFKAARYSLADCPELPMPGCVRKKYACGCSYSGLPEP